MCHHYHHHTHHRSSSFDSFLDRHLASSSGQQDTPYAIIECKTGKNKGKYSIINVDTNELLFAPQDNYSIVVSMFNVLCDIPLPNVQPELRQPAQQLTARINHTHAFQAIMETRYGY